MKKFRIIKSPIGDLYSIVLQSWEIDEEGKEVNNDGLNQSSITLEQADETERLFRVYGSKLKEK